MHPALVLSRSLQRVGKIITIPVRNPGRDSPLEGSMFTASMHLTLLPTGF